VNATETFNINATITDVTDLAGWELKLYYRNSILATVKATEEPFLKQGGSTAFFTVEFNNNYNTTHGRIWLTCTLLGNVSGVNGTGTLTTITFQAVAGGNTTLNLADTVLGDSLYYEPCRLCPGQEEYYQVYLYNKEVVDKIEKDYGEKVIVERIRFDSTEGMEKVKEYNLSLGDWNTIVVNHELKFLGGDKRVNETYLRKIIDLHLRSVGIHSISVVDVTCLPNSVSIGEQIKINVTIKNDGKYTELFNVTIFIDFISIKSFFVTDLEPGKEISLSFIWNVTEMPEGTHILSAKVYLSQNSTEHSSNYAFLEVKNQSS